MSIHGFYGSISPDATACERKAPARALVSCAGGCGALIDPKDNRKRCSPCSDEHYEKQRNARARATRARKSKAVSA